MSRLFARAFDRVAEKLARVEPGEREAIVEQTSDEIVGAVLQGAAVDQVLERISDGRYPEVDVLDPDDVRTVVSAVVEDLQEQAVRRLDGEGVGDA